MRITKLILLLFLIPFFALSQGFDVKHYTVKDGLADNDVDCITLDSLGRLVFVTGTSFNVYNGSEFRHYLIPDRKWVNSHLPMWVHPRNGVFVSERSGFLELINGRIVVTNFNDSLFWINEGNGASNRIGEIVFDNDFVPYINSNSLLTFIKGSFKNVAGGRFRGPDYLLKQSQENKLFVQNKNMLYELKGIDIDDSIALPEGEKAIGKVYSTKDKIFFTVKINEETRRLYCWDKVLKNVKFNVDFLGAPIKLDERENGDLYILTSRELICVKGRNGIETAKTLLFDIARTGGFYNDSTYFYVADKQLLFINLRLNQIVSKVNISNERMTLPRVVVDKEKNVWIGSNFGLFKVSPTNWSIFPSPIKCTNCYRLYIDRNGNNYLSGEQELYVADKLNEDPISHFKVNNKRNLWIYDLSNYGKQLLLTESDKINANSSKWETSFSTVYLIDNKSQNSVSNIELKRVKEAYLFDQEKFITESGLKTYPLIFGKERPTFYKELYFFQNSLGPFHVDNKNSITQYLIPDRSGGSDYSQDFYSGLYLFNNELYFNSLNQLYKFDTISKNFELKFDYVKWKYSFYGKGIMNFTQSNLYPIQNDRFLIIDSIGGVSARYLKVISKSGDLKFIDIKMRTGYNDLMIDQSFMFNNKAYLATSRGIFQLDFEADKLVKSINTSLKETVHAIHALDDTLLLFLRDRLVLLNAKDVVSEHFYPAILNGFPLDNSGTAYCEKYKKGGFLINTGEYWVNFLPNKSALNPLPNKLYCDKVVIANRDNSFVSYNSDSLIKKGLDIYSDDILSVYFDVSAMNDKSKINYVVNLNGLWSQMNVQKENFVRLNSLPPGTYTLSIRLTSDDKVESSTQLNIEMNVKPLWYQTKMMKVVYFLLIIAILISLFFWNSRRLVRKAEQLQSRIDQATVELKHQKREIEEKQVEILDSIRYAKRIQQALMTGEKYIEKSLKRLMFPKD